MPFLLADTLRDALANNAEAVSRIVRASAVVLTGERAAGVAGGHAGALQSDAVVGSLAGINTKDRAPGVAVDCAVGACGVLTRTSGKTAVGASDIKRGEACAGVALTDTIVAARVTVAVSGACGSCGARGRWSEVAHRVVYAVTRALVADTVGARAVGRTRNTD